MAFVRVDSRAHTAVSTLISFKCDILEYFACTRQCPAAIGEACLIVDRTLRKLFIADIVVQCPVIPRVVLEGRVWISIERR